MLNRGIAERDDFAPKIRKRGCSTPSSSSSKAHSYRFKWAISVGKKARGVRGSRSSTPVPAWRIAPLKSNAAVESPGRFSQKSNAGPVSARRLAATLWEMNEMPSPKLSENFEDNDRRRDRKLGMNMMMKREKLRSSVPPHLSDPSHSPVSERMDRSGPGSYQRRSSTVSQRHRPAEHSVGAFDSLSSASFMEIESRSRAQTPSDSVGGVRSRLKDVSNALTTSKELLKIINRVWANADQPSSSMSLVSALHAELERARLQVNQVIQDRRSDQNEISYVMKHFAEEKAAWKTKERQAVEAAVETVAAELEVERKLRRRLESLNKKLGKELADTKTSFVKAVKELESEKRARVQIEQVCDELARDAGDDKAEAEEFKRDTERIREEAEKEREMLHLADMLREERVQMKMSDAKHHFQQKNTAVDKLRRQIESFLGKKSTKEKRSSKALNLFIDEEDIASSLRKPEYGSHLDEERDDGGEVEDAVFDGEDDSADSELSRPIELSLDNHSKGYKWSHAGRNSYSHSGQMPLRSSSSLIRSNSDTVEWGSPGRNIIQNRAAGLLERDVRVNTEFEKLAQRKSSADETPRYKAVKGLRERLLANSWATGSPRGYMSPAREMEQPLPLRDHDSPVQGFGPRSGSKSRLAEGRLVDSHSARRSSKH